MTNELGSACSVIDKAEICAKDGGNLLVCGIANAQLNAVLNTCDLLIGGLRRTLTTLSTLSEKRYEQLVWLNIARRDQTEWINNYSQLNSILNEFGKIFDELNKQVSNLRSQANSLTLLEQFQQAKAEIDDFLKDATNFSEQTAYLLGMNYSPPPKPIIVKTPEPVYDNEVEMRMVPSSNLFNHSIPELLTKDFPEPIGSGDPEIERGQFLSTRWFYEEHHEWKHYDQRTSAQLEAQWCSSSPPQNFQLNDFTYNFVKYEKSKFPHIKKYSIRRGTWFWIDDNNHWVPYDHKTAAQLEDAAQTYGKFIVQVCTEQKRIVVGTVSDAVQYRQGKTPKPEGRKVKRGFS